MAMAIVLYLRRYGKPDVVHWFYSDAPAKLGLDRLLMNLLNRPGVVEWTGADIRIPEVEFAENPYYAQVYHDPAYEYRQAESEPQSLARQRRLAQMNFVSIAAPGMMQYVRRDIAPCVYLVQQRLVLSDYQPSYPETNKLKPMIFHYPSAPVAKGTAVVRQVIEQLQESYEFDFHILQPRTPRAQVLELMGGADIVLDQFVLGDRGIVSLEAMALGKPVVCYIKPSLVSAYPPDLPIVNATQDTLAEVLAGLLIDGARRRELGVRGRAYMEKHHDALKVVPELVRIYHEIIDRRRAS
jgi:hypothetical protein